VPSLTSSEIPVRARQFLRTSAVVLMAAIVATSCGAGSAQRSQQHLPSEWVSQGPTDSPPDLPVASAAINRDTIMRALDRSLSETSSSLVRRTTLGYAGVEVDSVDRLVWDGNTGSATSRMEIDERYLTNGEIRDLLDSMNRERARDDSDLEAQQLRAEFDRLRLSVEDLLDQVASAGSEMAPIGLGWWEADLDGVDGSQKVDLLIANDHIDTLVFTVDVLGSSGTSTWKFAG